MVRVTSKLPLPSFTVGTASSAAPAEKGGRIKPAADTWAAVAHASRRLTSGVKNKEPSLELSDDTPNLEETVLLAVGDRRTAVGWSENAATLMSAFAVSSRKARNRGIAGK